MTPAGIAASQILKACYFMLEKRSLMSASRVRSIYNSAPPSNNLATNCEFYVCFFSAIFIRTFVLLAPFHRHSMSESYIWTHLALSTHILNRNWPVFLPWLIEEKTQNPIFEQQIKPLEFIIFSFKYCLRDRFVLFSFFLHISIKIIIMIINIIMIVMMMMMI